MIKQSTRIVDYRECPGIAEAQDYLHGHGVPSDPDLLHPTAWPAETGYYTAGDNPERMPYIAPRHGGGAYVMTGAGWAWVDALDECCAIDRAVNDPDLF